MSADKVLIVSCFKKWHLRVCGIRTSEARFTILLCNMHRYTLQSICIAVARYVQ